MDFNLDRLRAFIIVARTCNLSAAAKELGTTQPNVGRQMTALQKEIELTLFERHSRGIYLTKEGIEFLELCNDIVGRLAQGVNVIREKDSDAKGILKFITGTGTLERVFEKLSEFSQKCPQVKIHFNSLINVLECKQFQTGDLDVGVIPATFKDSDLVQEHLFDMSLSVYASPKYLQLNPSPMSLKDLNSHKLIIYTGIHQEIFNKNLLEADTQDTIASFKVDSGLSMRNALVNGHGIGCYGYDQTLIERNLLVEVFPDTPAQVIPYYYIYHKRLEGSPKIKEFHDFMKEVVKVWQRPN
jgi:DNA-binding transcriptional LysR family regulator